MCAEIFTDYKYFRSTVAQKKIIVSTENDEMWTIFDAGPRTIKYPIIFLPPCSGTADIFFKQLIYLGSIGYRAISVNYPVIWNNEDWCVSFSRLLEKLNIYQIHIFGASLGGFLGQKFAEYTIHKSPKVLSMILCNTFIDTSIFKLNKQSKLFWAMPRYFLENQILSGLDVSSKDLQIKIAANFVKKKITQLNRSELASRLTLNCAEDYINPKFLQDLPITIIDVCDPNALTSTVNFEVVKCYPNAKRAHMKSGGNFPYISRTGEVNLFIQIHLQPFLGTPFMPRDSSFRDSVETGLQEYSNVTLDYSAIEC